MHTYLCILQVMREREARGEGRGGRGGKDGEEENQYANNNVGNQEDIWDSNPRPYIFYPHSLSTSVY